MGTDNLSKVLGPNMLWKDAKEGSDPAMFLVEAGKLNDIIEILIENHEYFFQVVDHSNSSHDI